MILNYGNRLVKRTSRRLKTRFIASDEAMHDHRRLSLSPQCDLRKVDARGRSTRRVRESAVEDTKTSSQNVRVDMRRIFLGRTVDSFWNDNTRGLKLRAQTIYEF